MNGDSPALPETVDRDTWWKRVDDLRIREKAHTREADAIAAERRRLPAVEVDPSVTVLGEHGRVPFLDVFEGRRQLIAFFHMWYDGGAYEDQCEGCTFYNGQVRELSYFHTRDVTYATLCQGSYEESVAYRDFMGWDVPWYSVAGDTADALLAGRPRSPGPLVCYLRDGERVFETYWTTARGLEPMAPTYPLLDMTVHGRQETWEDSPPGWPQPFTVASGGAHIRTDGRPTSQLSRLTDG